jgi:hypothetical protein
MRPANGEARRRRLMILPELGPIDGRSRPAILFRGVAAAVASDLGGRDRLTRAQLELVRRVAGLSVLADQIEWRIVNGQPIEVLEYTSIVGTQSRVLRSLGLKRVPKDITKLSDVLRPMKAAS